MKFDASVRAMVALNLKPHYERQAKERQGTRNDLKQDIVEKIPQCDAGQRAMIANQKHPQPTKSRDAAGKAAGVNGRYDKLTLVDLTFATVRRNLDP